MFFGPKTKNKEVGYNVIVPLKFIPISSENYILVNLGWISEQEIEEYKTINRTRVRRIKGILREPDWNKFTPNNSPENEVWTKINISEIAQVKNLHNISPYMLYATEKINNARPLHQKWYPRNKHKQYAIFWFSMAFIFLGFFVLYARSEKKKLS